MKRCLDLFASALLLLLTAPIQLLVAAAILVSMGRPILFFQVRPGLQGRPFTLVKFRTMRRGHGPDLEVARDAARLTPLGRFLRSLSLDELPQLWNVLRGDMSLVGPRPLLMQYLGRYSSEQARRHEVRPGITGWAQVHGRNAVSWEERFRLDVWYVDHRSLRLDFEILARTFLKVLQRSGVRAEGAATMHEFMGSLQTETPRRSGRQAVTHQDTNTILLEADSL